MVNACTNCASPVPFGRLFCFPCETDLPQLDDLCPDCRALAAPRAKTTRSFVIPLRQSATPAPKTCACCARSF